MALEARLLYWTGGEGTAGDVSTPDENPSTLESWTLPRLTPWSCLTTLAEGGPVPHGALGTARLAADEKDGSLPGERVQPPGPSSPIECRGELSIDHHFTYGASSRTSSVSSRLRARAHVAEAPGSPWSLEFSGSAPWIAEELPRAAPETEAPHQGIGSLALTRSFAGRASLRLGRFVPKEVASLGRVDACHAELRAGPLFRVGMVLGLRPDPEVADVSVERPVAATYLSTAVGRAGALRYQGHLGVMTTVYEGRPDRLAWVASHTAHLGTRLQVSSTTEVDLPTQPRSSDAPDVQLTTLRVEAQTPVTSFLCLRAGLDHRKSPDTREERAAAESRGEPLDPDGRWRRWIGCSQHLPGKLRLDQELTLDARPSARETEKSWAVSLTRTGLPSLPRARIRVSFQSMGGLSSGGVEGRFGGELAFFRDRLTLQPTVGLARRSAEAGPAGVEVTSFALRAAWQPSEDWSVTASGGWVFGDRPDTAVLQIGLRCWF